MPTGASVLKDARVDCLLTGEMSHVSRFFKQCKAPQLNGHSMRFSLPWHEVKR